MDCWYIRGISLSNVDCGGTIVYVAITAFKPFVRGHVHAICRDHYIEKVLDNNKWFKVGAIRMSIAQYKRFFLPLELLL